MITKQSPKLKIADLLFNELKVQTCVQWFFSDDISDFACYITLQVAQLPDHAPSQLTPTPNLLCSPLQFGHSFRIEG